MFVIEGAPKRRRDATNSNLSINLKLGRLCQEKIYNILENI